MKKYLLKLMTKDLMQERKFLDHMEKWNENQDCFLYKQKMIKRHQNNIKKIERFIERLETIFP